MKFLHRIFPWAWSGLLYRWGMGLMLMVGMVASGQTLNDDFSAYRLESDAAPNWEPQVSGWRVVNGGYEGMSGLSVWKACPYAAALTFSCDLTVVEKLKGDWLTAGIALCMDEDNYWAMNLVVTPENEQRRHTSEMNEMLKGTWLAQGLSGSRLENLPGKGNHAWQIGQTYRFELTLTQSNIMGRITQGTAELARYGYRFAESVPAVRFGRPAIRVGGLRVRVDNAQVSVQQAASEPKPQSPVFPAWVSRSGQSIDKPSGYFRVVEREGRWWMLDPEGKPFFDVGTDHISYRGHWCEKLGYAPYHRNMQAKYGSEAEWGKSTLRRLKDWGFNTLPAGHSPSLRHQGLPHILFASFGASFARNEWICEPIHWTGFPDVFSPHWEGHCRIVARKMARESLGDPWCMGTFLDNELEWYGKHGYLVDEVFQNPDTQASKLALFQWLVKRFGNLGEINRQLGTGYSDQKAFLVSTNVPKASAGLSIVRDEFLTLIAERYFSVPCQAMREADPNHMVLGCRFAGRTPTAVLAAAGKYNDVFTFNTYPRVDFENVWLPDGTGGVVERVPRELREYFAVVKRPVIITEWSFPALDSGLPCQHGAGMRVDTQEQKAACYRIFVNAISDLPFIIGYHYFMWADEPALGISAGFPEDSNYGLVNEKDEPYTPFIKVAKEVNQQAAQRHARSRFSAELQIRVGREGVELINTNKVPAHALLRLTVNGRDEVKKFVLEGGQQKIIPMASKGVWCAELQNWDGIKTKVVGGQKPSSETLINLAATTLDRVPAVSESVSPWAGLARKLAPGATLKIERPTSTLQKTQRIEVKSASAIWACSRKDGSLFDRIQAGDLQLGRLVFALHQEVNGQNQWNEAEKVNALEILEYKDTWLIEAEVERTANPHGSPGFRARIQGFVFKDLDLALVRPLWVENTDTRAWHLAEAFWFCRSAIGGSSRDDVVGGPQVPNYYRAAQFITDTRLGGCFGALDVGEPWRVMFWADPNGGSIHPDSRCEVKKDLSPGQKWVAEQVPFLWVYASRNTDAWKNVSSMYQQSKQGLGILAGK